MLDLLLFTIKRVQEDIIVYLISTYQKSILQCINPYNTDEEYFKWVVLRRINSIGVLWNRPSDAWLGVNGLKSEQRNNAFNALLNEGKISEITVDGMKHALYIATENLELLQAINK